MKNRRRAIDCKLVEASKTSPGYFKYVVTIKEKDGSVHEVPCYGYDMQDAIRRLIANEQAAKVVKVADKNEWLFPLLWFTIASIPMVIAQVTENPVYGQVGVLGMFVVAGGLLYYINRLNKGR